MILQRDQGELSETVDLAELIFQQAVQRAAQEKLLDFICELNIEETVEKIAGERMREGRRMLDEVREAHKAIEEQLAQQKKDKLVCDELLRSDEVVISSLEKTNSIKEEMISSLKEANSTNEEVISSLKEANSTKEEVNSIQKKTISSQEEIIRVLMQQVQHLGIEANKLRSEKSALEKSVQENNALLEKMRLAHETDEQSAD